MTLERRQIVSRILPCDLLHYKSLSLTIGYIGGECKNSSLFFFYFRLKKKVKEYNLIVASYDVVRNDIDFFR